MTSSLTNSAGFTSNLLAAIEGSVAPFFPEQADFGTFTFVSWLRTGAAAGGITVVQNQTRAQVAASFDVVADTGEKATVTQQIALYGPGDVIGIAPAQVIRREPEAGTVVAGGGTLAHIEFDDPALPWAFSPVAVANGDLQPWVALVVVPQSAAALDPGINGSPPRLTVDAAQLPSAADAWAWAHAQVPGAKNAAPQLAVRLGDVHGRHNFSRLICPRKLDPNTAYLACVVPTFEIGAKAGQDLPGGGLGVAWPSSGAVTLPVYYSWTFATGAEANFEELAGKLKAVQAPAGIGRRSVDISRPGGPIADVPGARQLMKCALYSPTEPPAAQLATFQNWPANRTATLRKEVGEGLASATGSLPRVAPRAYGRFQRGLTAMTGSAVDWFDQLNTRPVDRIAAGIGTRVVVRDAEKLVEAAWNQAGKVEEANDSVIDPAQFGEFVSIGIVKIGEDRMDLGPLIWNTNPVHGKLGWGAGKTLAGEIAQSALPRSATSPALRRLTAPGGRLARSIAYAGGEAAPFKTFVATSALPGVPATVADMRVEYKEPGAIVGLTAAMLAQVPEARARAALGAGWRARLERFVPAVDALARAPLRDVAVDVIQFQAERRGQAAERRFAAGGKLSAGRREALGGEIARALAASLPANAGRRQQILVRLASELPETAAAVSRLAGRSAPVALTSRKPAKAAKSPPVVAAGSVAAALQRFGTATARQTPGSKAAATVSARELRAALVTAFAGRTGGLSKTPGRAKAGVTRQAIMAALDPQRLSKLYMEARLELSPAYENWFDNGLCYPLTVPGPRFDRPMYEALLDYDRDWLVPGLGLIQEDQFVTLLASNARFIESYMIGLSDEMSRELLWRGYPSDPRSTAFRRFWNAFADEFDSPIDEWQANQALGSHFLPPDAGASPEDRLVLMIRGDLIRMIPYAIIVAQRGRKLTNPKRLEFAAPPAAGAKGATLFRASLADDTLVVGFDLTLADIEAPGGEPWYFLIAEHPGAPRFGLDTERNDEEIKGPDDLDWRDPPVDERQGMTFLSARRKKLSTRRNNEINWGTSSGEHARLLMQSPARIAIEASKLIKKIKEAG